MASKGRESPEPQSIRHKADELDLPSGVPAWITPSLIADTVAVWQPHYSVSLTVADAVEILQNVGKLFEILGNSDVQKFCGTGTCIESRTGA